MQVDNRHRYSLTPKDAQNANYVRALTTTFSFAGTDEKTRERNYGSAKTIVAGWVAHTGEATLYRRLDRLRKGEPFTDVFPARELAFRSSGPPSAADEINR